MRTSHAPRPDTPIPPHSIEAEISVLGGLLQDGTRLPDAECLIADDFYPTKHRQIMRAMRELAKQAHPIDLITVAEYLSAAGQLPEIGGATYLAELTDRVPSSANIAHHARIVHEKAVLRGVIAAATDVIEHAYGSQMQLLSDAIARLNDCQSRQRTTAHVDQTLATVVMEVMPDIEYLVDTGQMRTPGIASGLWELDLLLGGFHGGQLIVIGAGPSQGKTAFAVGVSVAAATAELPCAFVSCEMRRREIAQRTLSQISGTDTARLNRGPIMVTEHGAIVKHAARMAEFPVRLIDRLNDWDRLTPLLGREVARGARLVIVDFLQLLTASDGPREYWERMAYIIQDAKNRALQWDVPVLMLSQLKREGRGERRPCMKDLGGGGAVEAAADVIIFPYRVDKDREVADEALMIVAKHRNGPTGEAMVRWHKEQARFADMVPPEPPVERGLWK